MRKLRRFFDTTKFWSKDYVVLELKDVYKRQAYRAVCPPYTGIQQTEIFINFCGSSYGGTGIEMCIRDRSMIDAFY